MSGWLGTQSATSTFQAWAGAMDRPDATMCAQQIRLRDSRVEVGDHSLVPGVDKGRSAKSGGTAVVGGVGITRLPTAPARASDCPRLFLGFPPNGQRRSILSIRLALARDDELGEKDSSYGKVALQEILKG